MHSLVSVTPIVDAERGEYAATLWPGAVEVFGRLAAMGGAYGSRVLLTDEVQSAFVANGYHIGKPIPPPPPPPRPHGRLWLISVDPFLRP